VAPDWKVRGCELRPRAQLPGGVGHPGDVQAGLADDRAGGAGPDPGDLAQPLDGRQAGLADGAAAAVNLLRLDAWWTGKPLDRTRTTHLQRLDFSRAA
jgi:hypothetical protein